MLVSGVQHSDPTIEYIMKGLPRQVKPSVPMQNYYSTIDSIPYAVFYIPTTY